LNEPLARWAQRIQALSQTGLTYATDPYDRARYEELREIAAEMLAATLGAAPLELLGLFRAEAGYATPKVDVRGVVIRDDRVLLVRERSDGLWTLPGGWADVGDAPSHAVEREIWEESGYEAKVTKLLALYDRNRHDHPPMAFHVYKAFFRCEITGGQPALSDETDGVDFFALDALPPLSVERVTASQIARFFDHARHPDWPTDFD
jgi:ADP-ribose pyrophosphatase YjhB (NUDIX family)